jgi:tRNA pseudouridine13 synthase
LSVEQRYAIPEWPYAWGGPIGSGVIKAVVDDFIVEEILPFEPEGEGEHVFLHIEKCGENTEYVARLLARHAGVRQRDIGIAGLKDRHARTRQWFSVWLPGKEGPEWNGAETNTVKILQVVRHARKLKRGALSGNRFQITVRQWDGDKTLMEKRLRLIRQRGYPNYFGEQRFGRAGQNVIKALTLADGKKIKREQQSLLLSAARSFLFNQVLANRVEDHSWNRLLAGEMCQWQNSNSLFRIEECLQQELDRLDAGEIHPTASLWGLGAENGSGVADFLEQAVMERYEELVDVVTQLGVEAGRRSLRVMPQQMQWEFSQDKQLVLRFVLPAGSYATALLRELVCVRVISGE